MTDSRCAASRARPTAVIAPVPSRWTPITGCSSRVTSMPRCSSSPETESTRNGQSSVLVSSTEPSGS